MNAPTIRPVLAIALLATLAACAQQPVYIGDAPVYMGPPVTNIDPSRHGNLAAAQQLSLRAYERLSDAQSANDSQLGGHAARAKELLRAANEEIKLAAITANER